MQYSNHFQWLINAII